MLPAVRLDPAEAAFREVLEAMTARVVPRLQPRAWGDQLLVVGREVSEDAQGDLIEALKDLRRGFDLTL